MDNLIYNLQMFIKKISEKLYKFKNYANNIWLYNNNYKINRANSLLVYINLFKGGLVYIWLQVLNS